jgi:hypothetical protein
MCVRIELQALLQGFKLVYNIVRGDKSVIIITSQTSVAKALLFLSFARLIKRRVKEKECKKGVNIRFSFPGVYINEFSII